MVYIAVEQPNKLIWKTFSLLSYLLTGPPNINTDQVSTPFYVMNSKYPIYSPFQIVREPELKKYLRK